MDELIAWLRQQIADTLASDSHPGMAECDAFDGVHLSHRDAVALREAHTAILDITERYGHPDRIPATDFTTTMSSLAPAYALQRVLAAVAHAYRHHSGYEDATAFLRQPTPELVGQPIDEWPQIGRQVGETEQHRG